MHIVGLTAVASYLLLIISFAIGLIPASPIEGSGHLCPDGHKYFTVKSHRGVPYGTCCANNLPGAVWKDDRPACSLSVQFTIPAQSVEVCPPAASLITKGDLKVCVYSPLKPRSRSTCPAGNDYHIIFAPDRTPFGTCCPNNLPRAVWKDDMPACFLSVGFTTPARNVDTCEAGSRKADAKGLTVCLYDFTMNKRDGDRDTPSIEEAARFISGTKRTNADDPILQSDVCRKNGRWHEFEFGGWRWATCCDQSGPLCCNTNGCPSKPHNVKACFPGWEKRTLLFRGSDRAVCRRR